VVNKNSKEINKMGRYYVDNSSYFDNHPYSKPKIISAVKKGGGTNVRTSKKNGWSNQPSVVTFESNDKNKVSKAVEKALGTQWIIIRSKDW
jgi:hypothetical protein